MTPTTRKEPVILPGITSSKGQWSRLRAKIIEDTFLFQIQEKIYSFDRNTVSLCFQGKSRKLVKINVFTLFGIIFWSWQFIPRLEWTEPSESCSLSDATESGQLVCTEKQYEIQMNYSRHYRDSEKPPISGNKWSSPFKGKKVNPVQKGECQSAPPPPPDQQ